jgi:YjjG family noncanonical pyrimidine nucleotidase
MRYPVLLLDLDHTLIDSDAAEEAAFRHTLRQAGIPNPETHLATYIEINQRLWGQVERGELRPDNVRHVRFQEFVAATGLPADPETMANAYPMALAEESQLFPGARAVLEDLAATAALAMITNGLSDVQRTRIARLELEQYFDAIVISSEIGFTKPGIEIFDEVFSQLGAPARDTALMVGDSLTSDIAGGATYGLDTCWYNPHARQRTSEVSPTFEITDLGQIPGIALTGRL